MKTLTNKEQNEIIIRACVMMSVPYSAVKLNRNAIGVELKNSYYNTGLKYLKDLDLKTKQLTLEDIKNENT